MKFIQIVYQGHAPGTRELFTRTLTVNVSHIIKMAEGSSDGYNYRIVTLSNGEEVHLGANEYNTLIAMLNEDWKGVRYLSKYATHYGI